MTDRRTNTSAADDVDAALDGDERAQLRMMVRTLATHLGCMSIFVKERHVVASSLELARSALAFLGDVPGERT